MRAVAIALVLLFHLTPGRDSDLGLRSLLFKIADFGWIGVDLFFVLSGFLITGKLLEGRTELAPFRSFYLRRALRIFPIYYLVLFTIFVVLPAIAPGIRGTPLAEQLPFWLYYSNFEMPHLDPGSFASLGHFWSLAIEEQFYLLWPALVLRADRRRCVAFCLAFLAIAPILRSLAILHGADYFTTYAWTFLRADGLVIGSLLALASGHEAWKLRLRTWSLVAVAATGPLLLWLAWTHRGGLVFKVVPSVEVGVSRVLVPSAVAIFFGSILVLSLASGRLARPLSARLLRPVARYSYGIYIFHFLLIPLFDRWIPVERLAARASPNFAALVYLLTASAITFTISAASYHLVEARFLALKPARRPAPGGVEPPRGNS